MGGVEPQGPRVLKLVSGVQVLSVQATAELGLATRTKELGVSEGGWGSRPQEGCRSPLPPFS